MDFCRLTSSTPLSSKLNEKSSSRRRWFEDEKGQPFFGKSLLDYRDEENDDNDDAGGGDGNVWDNIESPGYIDFNKPSLELMTDQFFDLKKEPDNPTPIKKESMVLPTDKNLLDLTDTLNACSISMIDSEKDDNTMFTDDSSINTTVIDRTRHSLGPKMIKKNDSSNCQRRLSTIPSPFSFEVREESKHQRKQAKEAFKAAMEENQRNKETIFKAKPAPKIKPRVPLVTKITNTINKNYKSLSGQENQPLDQPNAGPRQKSYVVSKSNVKIKKPVTSNQANKICVSTSKTNTDIIKSTNSSKIISKIQPTTIKNEFLLPKIPKKSEKTTQTTITSIQKKNQKQLLTTPPPPPLIRSKSSTTKAKSPNLLTAKRAKQRQLLEEKARQKELELLQRKKNKTKEEELRLKEEELRLRKLTVHKPLPLPKFINNQLTKRQLSNPAIPTDVKRRRIV